MIHATTAGKFTHQLNYATKPITYTRPNAFDVEEDFIRPTQNLINEMNGKAGKTQIEGHKLDSEVLEKLSRSVAATGDDAAAWIQADPTAKPSQKRLQGNPVTLNEEEVEVSEKKIGFLQRIRRPYHMIREGGV